MPINNSKQASMVFLSQRIVSFYNDVIQTDVDSFEFYETEDSVVPKYKLNVSEFVNKFRCLQYKNFSAYNYQQTVCPFVLYEDSSVLYQTNFVHCQQSKGSIICTFWSTLSSGKSCLSLQSDQDNEYESYSKYGKSIKSGDKNGYYMYQPEKILKINVKNLDQFELDQQYNNIFCAVTIDIETLFVSDNLENKKIPQDVAIIKNRPIVLQQCQSNAPALDFSLQGVGGGGLKQHNHIPHIDGTGFAFSVFHPGTTMPQLSWTTD